MSHKVNIYNLPEVYESIWSKIEDNQGVLTPELEQELWEMEANKNKLATIMSNKIDEAQRVTELVDDKIKELQAKKKALENFVEGQKNLIIRALQEMNIDKIETGALTVKLRKNPPSVEITDESLIPKEYVAYIFKIYGDKIDAKLIERLRKIADKVEENPSKTKIKELFKKTGIGVNGTEVVQNIGLTIK